MTTEQLRKVIEVVSWSFNHKGLSISYQRTDQEPKNIHYILSPLGTVRALYAMACIDGYNDVGELQIDINGVLYSWDGFILKYQLCQWDALNIAIRHEAEKELNNDINILEFDSAINALK